ncbi:MAG: hypothetical protein PHS82_14100 [Lachnospiraceae bacterium]|nr:hypothetical protein [Lachnospiraceae bacterium]
MRCLVGFALFCIGIGMLVMLFIPKCFMAAVIAIALLLVGYNLFCCD